MICEMRSTNKNASSIQNNNTRFPSYYQYPTNPVIPGIFQAYRFKSLSDDAQDPFAVRESSSTRAIHSPQMFDFLMIYFITVTSYWTRWRLKSPASPLFTQPFIQAQIKESIEAPRHWPLCGELPAQMASNAENVSIEWRRHAQSLKTPVELTSPPENTFSLSAVYGSAVTKWHGIFFALITPEETSRG